MAKNRSRKRKLFHQNKQNEEGRVEKVVSEVQHSEELENEKNNNDDDQLKQNNDDDDSSSSSFPMRDISSLYVSSITHRCATVSKCVSCAYKCCCFDVALDTSFTSKVPNVRPEMCPRASSSSFQNNKPMIVTNGKHTSYSSDMKVLTVGDGDFSFSLAIARQMSLSLSSKDNKNNNNHQKTTTLINLVATSYEDEATLRRVYDSKTFANTLNELHRLGATVLFKVDATRLYECNEILDRHFFHRIVWNFPCAAIPNGQDGQNKEMELNRYLIQSFIQDNVIQYKLLDPLCGEIHMAHKTKPPYNQWKLDKLVVSSSSSSFVTNPNITTTTHTRLPIEKNNIENNHIDYNSKNDWKKQEVKNNDKEQHSNQTKLSYHGRIVLDKCLYPPYTPRKALDRKSFPCHDACIYVFGISKNNDNHPKCHLFNRTIQNNTCCHDFEKRNQEEEEENHLLIPMTKEIITYIRNVHLAEKKILQTQYEYSYKRKAKKRSKKK